MLSDYLISKCAKQFHDSCLIELIDVPVQYRVISIVTRFKGSH